MSLYGRLFARLYDPLLLVGERSGMRALRRAVVADARGTVLEIGAGTGLNLAHYPAAATDLTVCEPEAPMVARLRARVAAQRPQTTIVQSAAEALPFPDDHFDTVVSTLVLCTVDDLDAAIAELRRVLRPGGRLLLIEHVRAPEGSGVAAWQERLHGPWLRFGHGCHCNRRTPQALTAAGFDTSGLDEMRWPAMPPIVAPLVYGAAS